MSNKLVILAAILAIAGTLYFITSGDNSDQHMMAQTTVSSTPPAGFIVPKLTGKERLGEETFNANCAACHGSWATGTDQGPPLVHKIYEPSHHGDIAFHMAANRGVRAHHWGFGNMPKIEGMTKEQINLIIAYVRKLQRENGIH